MIFAVPQAAQQAAESPWIKVILALVALAFFALKIIEFILKRRETAGPTLPVIQSDPCKTCSRQVDDLHAWHAPDDAGSGRQSWKVPRDLVRRIEEIDQRTKGMERDLSDLCAKVGAWSTTTNPGG